MRQRSSSARTTTSASASACCERITAWTASTSSTAASNVGAHDEEAGALVVELGALDDVAVDREQRRRHGMDDARPVVAAERQDIASHASTSFAGTAHSEPSSWRGYRILADRSGSSLRSRTREHGRRRGA